MGNQIGHFQGVLDGKLLIIMYLLIVLSVVFAGGQRLQYKKRRYCLMVCMLTLFGVYSSCLSRVERTFEHQPLWVWGRYIIRIFMLIPLIYGTKQEEDERSLVSFYIQSILLSFVACNIIWIAMNNSF